ncbi:MAG: hypothetical protein ACE5GT_06065 [Rhodospirillales bacterium]
MALPTSPNPNAPQQLPASAGRGMRWIIWIVIISLLMMVISLPTVLLVFFGMLPTIVAWIIDRSAEKYATFCVGGMNFSGVFPFLGDIWFKDHSVDATIAVMTNVFDLMVIYGAAGFGWMVFIAVPPVVTTFLQVMSQRRVTVLRTNQSKIIEEWGDDVTKVLEVAKAAGVPIDGAPLPAAAPPQAPGVPAEAPGVPAETPGVPAEVPGAAPVP